ncbi:hypothetical protein HLB35_14605 [Halomonas sp. TBZ9]|uniref:HNH endonuclease n=1 Tax=Vreelandella azerica TaxID=2732867 RepID=A0A7Y3XAE3_9GAMM|nr:hypothetical protein [Halomonas azerica]NOG32682.1 hypothetical protein [Halomonas azerica]
MVKVVMPNGKKAGIHTGRASVRKTGSFFNVQTKDGAIRGFSHKHCTVIQLGDGYGYHLRPSSNQKGDAEQAMA